MDSADEARRFLQGHGVPEDSIRRVWTAIALHTTPGIPQHMEPEVALVTAGVDYDVLGIGYHDISDADRAAITDRRNPVSSQASPVSLACSPRCRVGSAGITAELSTAYARAASDTTARITLGRTG